MAHVFLDALVFPGNPSVLAQVAEPGILLVNLRIATWLGNILENTPAEGAVSAANDAEQLDRLQEGFALVKRNFVLYGHQHRPTVLIQFLGTLGVRPVPGWSQVGRFARAKAEFANRNRSQQRAGSGED